MRSKSRRKQPIQPSSRRTIIESLIVVRVNKRVRLDKSLQAMPLHDS
jgi:hypothetical protein